MGIVDNVYCYYFQLSSIFEIVFYIVTAVHKRSKYYNPKPGTWFENVYPKNTSNFNQSHFLLKSFYLYLYHNV